MNKSDLITALAEKKGITPKQAIEVLSIVSIWFREAKRKKLLKKFIVMYQRF